MATAPSTAEQRESREQDRASKSQMVIVELAGAQSSQQIKRLRRGRGRLATKVERIISDLAAEGTVKATAQPVVIVVREAPTSLWPFGGDADDDDDEDD